MKDLTLIIPAKNEHESLPKVLNELKDYDLNIMIVLREEDLETINSIKDFNCKITYQDGYGYGDALINGISLTTTKYFCIFNADGSFKPEELKNMYDMLENTNNDFIFASRYQKILEATMTQLLLILEILFLRGWEIYFLILK